jgi:hypothetical protein
MWHRSAYVVFERVLQVWYLGSVGNLREVCGLIRWGLEVVVANASGVLAGAKIVMM